MNCSAQEPRHKLAVCIGRPLSLYTDWPTLLRFLLLWRANGASKFVFYYDSATKLVKSLLQVFFLHVHSNKQTFFSVLRRRYYRIALVTTATDRPYLQSQLPLVQRWPNTRLYGLSVENEGKKRKKSYYKMRFV